MEAFHISWATHNSRVSERMKEHNVKPGVPVILSDEQEVEVTKYISEVVIEDGIKILAYNICKDHVHMILVCEPEERDRIVQKIKSVSSKNFHKSHPSKLVQGVMTPCSKEGSKFHLWQQKYNWTAILNDEQFAAVYDYVQNNRIKHRLKENQQLEEIINKMISEEY